MTWKNMYHMLPDCIMKGSATNCAGTSVTCHAVRTGFMTGALGLAAGESGPHTCQWTMLRAQHFAEKRCVWGPGSGLSYLSCVRTGDTLFSSYFQSPSTSR